MSIRAGLFALLSILFAFSSSLVRCARARAFEITPVGTLQVSYLASPPSSSSGTGWGYGGLLSQFLSQDVQIEAGFLYLQKSVNLGPPPVKSETFFYEEIPILLRVQPKGSHFSFGAGGYYAWGIGNFKTELPGATSPSYVSYQDGQISRQDYGAIGAIGFRWPIAKAVEIYTDARFSVGIKNIDTSGGQSLRWRDYFQAILGLSFDLTYTR